MQLLEMFIVILPVALIVALAFWQRSNFLFILGGLAAIGFGVFWIDSDPGALYMIEGMAVIGIGLYMLITTAVDMFRSKGS